MNDAGTKRAEKPFVSVVVPIYNVEPYLKQCVDSIIHQTLKNIEIILVDDGSPDSCPVICDAYAKEDNRIKVIHQPNGGYGKACNAGFDAATGEYIGIVESDDYAELDMFEKLYKTACETRSPIVKGSFFYEYQNGIHNICSLGHITKNQKKCTLQEVNNLHLMLYESSIWSAIYNSDFIQANEIRMFESKGASYQDAIWKFQSFSVAESITLIDEPVYHYRVMAQNSSRRNSKNYDAHFNNYAEIRQFLVRKGKFEDYKKSYYLHQFSDTVFHIERLDRWGRKQHCEKMKDVILSAKQEGITIDSFGDYDISPDIRKYYHNIVSGKTCGKGIIKPKIKLILLAFYCSKAGQFIWHCLEKLANSRYIRKILLKLLYITT